MPDVAAGRYEVTIEAKGYTASTVEVVVAPGETVAGLLIPAMSKGD